MMMRLHLSAAMKQFLAIACFGCWAVLTGNAYQNSSAGPVDKIDKKVMEQEISSIIQQAVRQATIKTPQGVTVTTTPLVSAEDIDKVKKFGDAATSSLRVYIVESKNSLEQQVALRLLGALGTERALEEIRVVAQKAPAPFIRSLALTWIASTGLEKDTLLLQIISSSDSDAQVRAEAARLLKRKREK